MAKNRKGEPDKPKESVELTEWQKLHQSYLEKKAKEEADEKQKQEEKKQRLLEMQKEIEDKQGLDEETEEESELEKTEEKSSLEEKEEDVSKVAPVLDEERLKREKKLAEVAARRHKKEEKRAAKLAKKEEKRKQNPPISRRHLYRAFPILVTSLAFLLIAVYFLTPFATKKVMIIQGNKEVTRSSILDSSAISEKDYVVTTFLNQAAYERNIKDSNPWIKKVEMSYQFPDTFTIQIQEYSIVAYNLVNEQYYPVLETGAEIGKTVSINDIPEGFTTLKLTDQGMLKDFVRQLPSISEEIKTNIQEVALTPSKATKDLLTLTMYDGNQILIPLSEVKKKLPYYSGIRHQLTVPSLVDMEAGIFSRALS